ncbi:MAG: DUF2089 domain-containing protein [Limnochordales bacterium]|nr:DUF2089 domain-containing protein [Limnochordales bacterium]
MIGRCPVCGGVLEVARLECPECGSALEGRFRPCRFCQLNQEQQQFIEVFLTCRGNIKEVERVLGISYPTVRNRLEQVIESLGYPVDRRESTAQTTSPGLPLASERRREILEALGRGEISVEEAIRKLKGKAQRNSEQ